MIRANNTLQFIAGCFATSLLLVTCFYAINWSLRVKQANQASNVEIPIDSRVGTPQLDSPIHAPTARATMIEDLEHFTSNFELEIALDEMLLTANGAQLTHLLEVSKRIASSNKRVLVQNQIVGYLAAANPEHALAQTQSFPSDQRDRFTSTILREWSFTDLDSAVEYTKLLDYRSRRSALLAILNVRDDLSQQAILEIAESVEMGQYGRDQVNMAEILSRSESIETVWRSSLNGYIESGVSFDALNSLGRAWIDHEGIDALNEIARSLADLHTERTVGNSLFGYAAEQFPQETFEIALQQFKDTNWSEIESVVYEWRKVDPEAVISAIAKMDPNALRLKLYRSVGMGWAQDDPWATLANLSLFPEDMRTNIRSNSFSHLRDISTSHADQLIANLAGDELNYAAQFITRNWTKENFEDAFMWVLTNPVVAEFRPILMWQVLDGLTVDNASSAVQLSLPQPVDADGFGPEARVIGRLAHIDVEAATALLPKVRKGKTLLGAHVGVGLGLLAKGDKAQAIELSGRVPQAYRLNYFDGLTEGWAASNPKDLFESLDKLPTERSKSRAAFWLLAFNRYNEDLSESETELCRSYLTGEDARALNARKVHTLEIPD